MKYYKLLLITLATCVLLILESIDERLNGWLFLLPGLLFPVGIILAVKPVFNVIRSIILILASFAIWYGCFVLAYGLAKSITDYPEYNFITQTIINSTMMGAPGMLGALLMYLLVVNLARIKPFSNKLFYSALFAGFLSGFFGIIFSGYLVDLRNPFGDELSFSTKLFPIILFWQLSVGYFILRNFKLMKS